MEAVLSTGEIARDNHAVDPDGWIFAGTVPFVDSHRDAEGIRSVIGKVTNIRVGAATLASGRSAKALLGVLNFADGGTNPDAETAYQLFRGGFADALSVSFLPITYQRARDRNGLNISKAELLEVSAVAVPSDINARVIARALRAQSRGRDTEADRTVLRAARGRAIRERCRRDDELHGFSHLWLRR
jgi:hypothetical protein